MDPDDYLVLIDGSAVLHRAYHAASNLTRPSDGAPVGGVYRVFQMMWHYLVIGSSFNRPQFFAIVLDAPGATFRHELLPDYKAHRSATPPEMQKQRTWMRQAFDCFGVRSVELTGVEADDLIATYTRLAREADGTVLIGSADKDLLQLVRAGVRCFSRAQNGDKSTNIFYDSDAVMKKMGVWPEQLIDFLALTGDTSDNIPGVPGIGPKIAAKLIEEYGDLEGVLSHAAEIRQPARRQNIIDNADAARLALQLVTLKDDIDPPVPLDDFRYDDPDPQRLREFCREMEFESFLRAIDERF